MECYAPPPAALGTAHARMCMSTSSTGTVGEVVILVAHRGAKIIAALPRLAVLRQKVRERAISRAADTLALQHEAETHASQSSSGVDMLPLVERAIPSAQGTGILTTFYFLPLAMSSCLQAPSLTWSCSSARMRAWGLRIRSGVVCSSILGLPREGS